MTEQPTGQPPPTTKPSDKYSWLWWVALVPMFAGAFLQRNSTDLWWVLGALGLCIGAVMLWRRWRQSQDK